MSRRGKRQWPGELVDPRSLLWHQTVAVAAVIGFTVAVTYAIAVLLRATVGLCADDDQQSSGLCGHFTPAAVPVVAPDPAGELAGLLGRL